jgi:hypothetical protein
VIDRTFRSAAAGGNLRPQLSFFQAITGIMAAVLITFDNCADDAPGGE